MTIWISWDAVNTDAVRAAYDALGIGETLQANVPTYNNGTAVVGSDVLTIEQAATLPVTVHTEHPEGMVRDD